MAFLEARDLSKSFAAGRLTRQVLDRVSLTVEAGEFVSIVGPMGSGKSTLLSLLAGLTIPDRGDIRVEGEPLRGIRPDAAYVFQNYSLLPWFSALENVRLAVGAAFPGLSRDEQRARAKEMLERVGLGNALSRRPAQLSGGMRQRVALARAFSTGPRVLFLDEPFGALDALTRETLQQDLMDMCRRSNRAHREHANVSNVSDDSNDSNDSNDVTTIMITNSVEEAILLSDRIIPILPGPPATLGSPIIVDLARPRSAAQLAHDEHATHVRAHVVTTLTAAVKRTKPPAAAVPLRADRALSGSPARTCGLRDPLPSASPKPSA